MPYFGAKPYGHDATLVELDCERRALFIASLEQVTRLKKDIGEISLIAPFWSKQGRPRVESIHLSFAAGNEYQALREMIPLEMGLLTHPVRDVVRNHKLSPAQKRERAKAYGEPWSSMVEAWLKIESMLYANDARHKRVENGYWLQRNLERLAGLGVTQVDSFDHHTCHAASAAFHAPFDHGVVVTLDGWGNNCFSKVFRFEGHELTEVAASNIAWTWGYLYGRVTRTLGYFMNADEGKVEALACFAEPDEETLTKLLAGYRITDDLRIEGDGKILQEFWEVDAFARRRDAWGPERVAATIQTFLERKGLEYFTKVREVTGAENLACAGGICANVKMNQQVFEKAGFKGFYVTPAMNDSGSAQGAAYLAAIRGGEDLEWLRDVEMPYFGAEIRHHDVRSALKAADGKLRWQAHDDSQLQAKIVDAVTSGKIVALCRGRSEFGPRALGHRSILADPRGDGVKDTINKAVKRREWFQPFCPSILDEERTRLFSASYPNRHMTCAFTMEQPHADQLSAVVHVDKTSRPQFVRPQDDVFYYKTLQLMKQQTGYGVLLNTSFNLHGRAMVLTPDDAVQDFIDCGLDAMVLGDCWVEKADKV